VCDHRLKSIYLFKQAWVLLYIREVVNRTFDRTASEDLSSPKLVLYHNDSDANIHSCDVIILKILFTVQSEFKVTGSL
jgi:hypothetical protein